MQNERVKQSYELYERARQFMPGGVQKARRPANFLDTYPVFMERSDGAHVWDADGNEYVDWLLSYGPMVLGHRYGPVDDAVRRAIEEGVLLDLTRPVQIELAQKLTGLLPSAEMVQFVNTGSGATSAAVRIARIYTGKWKIIRWGYHGWHDWCCPDTAGVPPATLEDVLTFSYNDLDSLEQILEQHRNQIACIIMMPLEVIQPQPGFLEGVRELADAHNVVLIFDEVRSWPRMALGGAQAYFSVTPDMTTISKGIANGYPLAAVVGKAEIMEVSEQTTISGTFFPSTIGLNAALVTLQELERTDAVAHMWHIGKLLSDGLKELVTASGVTASVLGPPVMPFLIFGDPAAYEKVWYEKIYQTEYPGTDRDRQMMRAFYEETVKQGIFFHPRHHWFSSLAHTEDDVKYTLAASEKALELAKKKA